MSRLAAHRDLVVFQIADARAAGVACFWGGVAVAVGVAAQLGADAEDVAEDVLEEGFEGWDCGGDEAGVELGADPDCDSCSVVCGFGEYLCLVGGLGLRVVGSIARDLMRVLLV